MRLLEDCCYAEASCKNLNALFVGSVCWRSHLWRYTTQQKGSWYIILILTTILSNIFCFLSLSTCKFDEPMVSLMSPIDACLCVETQILTPPFKTFVYLWIFSFKQLKIDYDAMCSTSRMEDNACSPRA